MVTNASVFFAYLPHMALSHYEIYRSEVHDAAGDDEKVPYGMHPFNLFHRVEGSARDIEYAAEQQEIPTGIATACGVEARLDGRRDHDDHQAHRYV